MGTSLALFDPNNTRTLELPEHLRQFIEEESNIKEPVTVPSLSPGGRKWTVSVDGQKVVLTNADGDTLSTLKVVILEYAKRRGRAYYPGNYNADSVSQPTCWSDDGIAPHPSVPIDPVKGVAEGAAGKQAMKCEGCPMSIKGSKTFGGKAMVACSQHRMLAVVPADNLDMTPLRLKIAITSDYDETSKDLAAINWFGYQQYLKKLRTMGITHTAAVVTRMKFDPQVDYPKIVFFGDRLLEPAETAKVREILASGEPAKRLAGWTPAGADGVPAEDGDAELPTQEAAPAPAPTPPKAATPAPAAPPATQPAAPKPTPAPAAQTRAAATKAEYAAAAQAPTPGPVGNAAQLAMMMDDDAPKSKAQPAAAPVAEVATSSVEDEELNKVLDGWDA